MRRGQYDRDWTRWGRDRRAHQSNRFDQEFDRGGRFGQYYDDDGLYTRDYERPRQLREMGYSTRWFRSAPRYSSPPRYQDEYRPRPAFARRHAAPRRVTDTLWATPSHRRHREPPQPWTGAWRPDEWWHAIGPEPRADYDWAYEARRPERYGWTGETGRG